jgi:hypothetical protein
VLPADRLAKSFRGNGVRPTQPSNEGLVYLFGYLKCTFGEDQTAPALRPLVTEDGDSI